MTDRAGPRGTSSVAPVWPAQAEPGAQTTVTIALSPSAVCLQANGNSQIYMLSASSHGEPVVLKVLNAARPTARQLHRLRNEYDSTKDLAIAGVRRVIAQARVDDKPALMLEYVDAHSLYELFVVLRQSLADCLWVAVELARILGEVHAHHLIHRDVNSHNILVNLETRQVRLIDFGLATRIDLRVQPRNPEELAGTLAYMAPEQTGRMNRIVDYRADLYSLGVTLYEVLTGQLPFAGRDPLALVHAHIAKPAPPVSAVAPAVPQVVSAIVMKLMAKNPEDRYQSAFGLAADLQRCWDWVKSPAGQANPDGLQFALGQEDYSGQLNIPEKLYGRSAETALLLSALDRAAAGSRELLLVSGPAGVGKTALVAELHKPSVEKRGCFISGKFGQYQRNVPYAAFTQAFNQFAEQLLTERDATLESWRATIQAALGDNAAVLTEVMPTLERVIGVQPAVLTLGPQEDRNRFNLTFQRYVEAISAADHPLVVFIDDWQWADLSSLDLLKVLLSSKRLGCFLLIAAYRDNEVDSTHPFMLAIDDLAAAGVTAQRVEVGNLQPGHVRQLVAESVGGSADDSDALADLLVEKTKGNAFFVHQFLRNLYEQEWLRFDFTQRRGVWDLGNIQAQQLTDNVVDLLAWKLQKLPAATTRILQLAACVGNEFDAATLGLINETPAAAVLSDLTEGLKQGLVMPLDDYYMLPELAGQARFRFLHDRIQQAAYALIPQAERASTHLRIAQSLQRSCTDAEPGDRLFEIANHFNQGLELLEEPDERRELATLNLRAGQKAQTAAAFRVAWDYFTIARRLLPQDSWHTDYDVTLKVYDASVEAAYLIADFAAMEDLAGVVLTHARTLLDQVKTFEMRFEALGAQGRFSEAIATGLRILELLGVVLPGTPAQEDVLLALAEANSALQGRRAAELLDLPPMTDPHQLAVLRILVSMSALAFLSAPALYVLIVTKQLSLCARYGNVAASTFSYASYALVLCGAGGDLATGCQFGQLALDLQRRLDAREWFCKVNFVTHAFVLHWMGHLREMLQPFRAAYLSGLETGDFQFAAYSALLYVAVALCGGTAKALPELRQEAASLTQTVRQVRQMASCRYLQILQQALHDLVEGRSSSKFLKGDDYDEETMLPEHLQTNDWIGAFYVHFNKLLRDCVYGDSEQAVADADATEPYLDAARAFPYEPIFRLYDSLARLSLQRAHPQSQPEALLRRIADNQAKLSVWAAHAPMNCRHKYDLVEAERLRTFGDPYQAGAAYDRAIAAAHASGYVRDEAVANELAATFYLDQGRESLARAYMADAHRCYKQWGALGKLRDLERQHRRWFAPVASSVAAEQPTGLDLQSVMKASQAISGQIVLADLLRKLMAIVIENAGAERGCLILARDGHWVVEAEGCADRPEATVLQAIDVEMSEAVCRPVVRYVVRRQASLVLDDAAREGPFVDDPYVKSHQTRSLLCAPLLNRGQLSGILYLENSLTVGSFTWERLQVLELLAGQCAIALDNARLFEQVQKELTERKQAEIALRKFQYSVDQVSIAVYWIDRDGRLFYANAHATRSLGYTHEELLRLRLWDIDPVYPMERWHEDWERYQERRPGGEEFFESVQRRKDGSTFPVEVVAKHLWVGDEELYVAFVRDITERKQAEAELEQRIAERTAELASVNEELEAFAYSVSHDLRAPLRVIDGFTRILVEDHQAAFDAEGRRLCAVIQSEAQRMAQLINDLLEFSRSSRAPLSSTLIDTSLMVKTIIEELSASDQSMRVDFQLEPLPAALGDRALIRQVWINLIGNAVKFSAKRARAEIAVGARVTEAEQIYWVRDNGAGFDMQYAHKIFTPFQRLHSQSEFSGTGIGLAIVHRIIARHGGRAWAEGAIDKGATFYFSLPRGQHRTPSTT